MRSLLREPLVHFLVAGALLFALYAGLTGSDGDRSHRIVVDEERVALLARSFERTWLRPPSAAELRGLVEDHVTEEILYREALALGLDRDDPVVRRRMRQKMEFLNLEVPASEPGEEELRAYLAAHPERFRAPTRLSLEQLFLDPASPRPVSERAAELLGRLSAGEGPEGLGDPTLLPRQLEDVTPAELAGSFGPAFAEAVAEAPVGAWSGPWPSAFGAHLVRVAGRAAPGAPELGEVRPALEREWQAERREQATQRFYRSLRERYEVEVRMPPDAQAADSLR